MNATHPERWLPIAGYEGHYEVSDHGNVRSLDRVIKVAGTAGRSIAGAPVAPHLDRTGYWHIKLWLDGKRRGFRVHQLVARAFLGQEPDGMHCCHTNGIATDNRVENLRWDTPKQNVQDSLRHGTFKGRSSLTHCKWGHEYAAGNLYTRPNGQRQCRSCIAIRSKEYRERKASRQQ